MQLSNEPCAHRNLKTSVRQIHVIDDIRFYNYKEENKRVI